MKLCTISDGDTAYRYDKSIVVYFQGKRKVLSTSVFNGAITKITPPSLITTERQAQACPVKCWLLPIRNT